MSILKNDEPGFGLTAEEQSARIAIILILARYRQLSNVDYNSTYEGFAHLQKEMDNLWAAVKSSQDHKSLNKITIQLAATLLKFMINLTMDKNAVSNR